MSKKIKVKFISLLSFILVVCLLVVNFTENKKKKIVNDISGDTKMSDSVIYANSIANGIQGYYTTRNRSSYVLENQNSKLIYNLTDSENKMVSSIETLDGKSYLSNTMDTYVVSTSGAEYFSSCSGKAGRINTTRLGYYYYNTHVYDLGYSYKSDGVNETNSNFSIEDFDSNVWNTNGTSGLSYITKKDKSALMYTKALATVPTYFERSDINVSSNEYDGISVSYNVENQEANVEAYLYYFTEETGSYNENQKILLTNNIKNDLRSDYFKGIIKSVKLVFVSNLETNIEVSFVRFSKMFLDKSSLTVDRTFDAYSDKMHQQARLIKTGIVSDLAAFGIETKVEKSKVTMFEIKDDNGSYNNFNSYDASSVNYIAFYIKDVGVVGLIFPSDGSTKSVSVSDNGTYYIIRQEAFVTSNLENDVNLGNRIYTEAAKKQTNFIKKFLGIKDKINASVFSGIESESYIERNPLTDISINSEVSDNAMFLKYDALRGAYQFTMDGSDFNTAYYETPNKYFSADITINNSDSIDRKLYIWMNTPYGSLESAVLLDDTDTLIPLPMQVGKNFRGEFEEPLYDPNDFSYGDTIFPMVFDAGESQNFTLLNLYQNWGEFPLKQLSSIQFFVSYYHLSCGVTESNCIAPYYVYNDGWVLPDFRGRSGKMWEGQPQFDSLGQLYFCSLIKDDVKYTAEYTGSDIISYGPSYVCVDYSYLSSDGQYKYTLTHTEFPQTDENRTYYNVNIEFLESGSIDNTDNMFSIFEFSGKGAYYSLMSYTDTNNNILNQNIEPSTTKEFILGTDNPIFTMYNNVGEAAPNMAVLIKNVDADLTNTNWNGDLRTRLFSYGVTSMDLSLNTNKINFKKGDSISLDLILMPWGTGNETTADNVIDVQEDSLVNPLTVTASVGSIVKETWLPRILCKDNTAQFTISGGANNNAVRIDGFTKLCKPIITELVNGEWISYNPSSTNYDGYSVFYNKEDGTYSYAFVYNMDVSKNRTFKIDVQ